MSAKQPLRRVGAVLGLTHKQVLVWINGVTTDDGQWMDLKWLPPVLHDLTEESTFDVWLYDGEPVECGAYRPQEHSGLSYTQSRVQ